MKNEPGRILIADDDRMQRMLLTRTLTQQGHSVEAVENGQQVLEMLQKQPFDAVLCDVSMPDMDGFQVLERMMSDDVMKLIPVVMVSGFSEMAGVVACIEMGAADYLHKPTDPALLRARVDSCLAKKRWDEQEVAFRRELEEKYRQLQELVELRDSLSHMIVHDLRTPLTSFLAGLQTAQCLGELSPEQKECLGMSVDGGHILLSMINDLLDISKMESGSLVLECRSIEIPRLCARSLEHVAWLIKDKNLNIVTEFASDLPPLFADEEKLCRTLVNLLGNAIKFTPSDSTIMLGASLQQDEVVFNVRDRGEGIPPEAFGRIFEKFGQVETRKAGRSMSTGLGLTFCKMVVEAHGGRIWVESEIGEGSDFLFAIPMHQLA
ncbi:MAG TPA: response regulator [Abditibacteriaceae bacterium]|nr:response regulator [Abditibacteriaceae bacterium]